MRQDYEKLFTRLEPPEPPEGLLPKIMAQINRAKCLRDIKWRLAFFAALFIGSATAMVPAFQLARQSLTESGFMEFCSLVFADARTVMIYWDSFLIALFESLPVISITAFLAVILVFIESLKFVAQYLLVAFAPIKIIKTN